MGYRHNLPSTEAPAPQDASLDAKTHSEDDREPLVAIKTKHS